MDDLRNKLKTLFESNILSEEEPLDFGFDPSSDTEDQTFGFDEPEEMPKEPEQKILKTSGIPKGKKPPKLFGIPVQYDMSTPMLYNQAVEKNKSYGKVYSNVKESIVNYFLSKMNRNVDPNNIERQTDDGVSYTKAFLKNFSAKRGSKESSATFDDVIADMVSISIADVISQKEVNFSMQRLKEISNTLNVDDDRLKEFLTTDTIKLIKAQPQVKEFEELFDTTLKSRSKVLDYDRVRKIGKKILNDGKVLSNKLESMRTYFQQTDKNAFEKFISFTFKLDSKVRKIQDKFNKGRKTSKKDMMDSATAQMETLSNTVTQYISLLDTAEVKAAE